LEIEVLSPRKNDVWQVFYDLGKGYREGDSSSVQVNKVDGMTKVTFDLFYLKINGLRIDPGTHAEEIYIKSITFKIGDSSRVWAAKRIVQEFRPLNQINGFKEDKGVLHIKSVGEDPYFEFASDFGKIDDSLSRKHELERLVLYLFGLILAIGLFIYFEKLSRLIGAIKPDLKSVKRNFFTMKNIIFKLAVSILFFILFIVLANNIVNSIFLKKSLEIEILSQHNSDMWQVFYDLGHGYRESDSSYARVGGYKGKEKITFALCYLGIKHLRIDPGTHAEDIYIKSITYRVGNYSSRVWSAKQMAQEFRPLNQIKEIKENNGFVYIKSTGTDPYFEYGNFEKVDQFLTKKYDLLRALLYLYGFFLSIWVYYI